MPGGFTGGAFRSIQMGLSGKYWFVRRHQAQHKRGTDRLKTTGSKILIAGLM